MCIYYIIYYTQKSLKYSNVQNLSIKFQLQINWGEKTIQKNTTKKSTNLNKIHFYKDFCTYLEAVKTRELFEAMLLTEEACAKIWVNIRHLSIDHSFSDPDRQPLTNSFPP